MRYLLAALVVALMPATATIAADRYPTPWLGLHVLVNNAADADKLKSSIPGLARVGVNALVVETAYNFDFQSHPELAPADPITRQQARGIGDLCRANHIRVIPEINCLGHQSWSHTTLSLLAKHPDLDETPGKYPNNENPAGREKFYCRSWCPSNPDVNKTVFSLIDELIDAFGADAFHVGMDEVFVIADKDCPRCGGKDPADLFASQVNSLHDHLTHDRHVQMFMWADRLLDSKAMGYSRWEASANGTAPAVDRIPKDIVLCDWHYEKQQGGYPSIAFLLGKGFQVWPTGWKDAGPTRALLDEAIKRRESNPKMLGYLSSTWGHVPLDKLADFEPTKIAAERLKLGTEVTP